MSWQPLWRLSLFPFWKVLEAAPCCGPCFVSASAIDIKLFSALVVLCLFLNPLESRNILVAMFVQVVSESRFRLTFLVLCRLPLLSLSLPPPLLLLLSCYLCCPSTGLLLGHLCCSILFVVTVAFAFVLFMFHVLNIYVVDLSLVSDRLV